MPSSPLPSILPPESGSWLTVVLGFCGATVASVLAYFGGRGQAAASLQASLNDAFRSLTGELQVERSALIAHVSALEGRNRQLTQQADSLRRLLQRHEINIPDLLKDEQ